MNSSIFDKVKRQKEKQFGSLCIPGRVGDFPFVLTFITYDCLENFPLIDLLASWRKAHEIWFQAQFPITHEQTKRWLQERVLDIPDRMLFLIDVQNEFVGHVGLFRYDEENKTIDIDNIVRGKEEYKGIMFEATKMLMEWGKKELKVKGYTLQTTSDNTKALALYRRLGFVEKTRIPLVYQQTQEGGEWIEVSSDTQEEIKRWAVFMKLEEKRR